jgi:hypothetical protein
MINSKGFSLKGAHQKWSVRTLVSMLTDARRKKPNVKVKRRLMNTFLIYPLMVGTFRKALTFRFTVKNQFTR